LGFERQGIDLRPQLIAPAGGGAQREALLHHGGQQPMHGRLGQGHRIGDIGQACARGAMGGKRAQHVEALLGGLGWNHESIVPHNGTYLKINIMM